MKKLFIPTLLIAPVLAQEIQNIKLEEVVTTATREEEKVSEIPARVDTVPKEELKLDRPVHIKEDMSSLPGVLITQVAASLGHATAIRLPINYGPYYLYLQDEIPVQSSGFFNHNALWWTTWESSLGGVEVLKGVGTAFYGSDAIGAVINVKSEKISKVLERNLQLEGGEYGYLRVKGKVSDTIKKNGYLASFSYSQSDGWREKTRFKRGEVTLKHMYKFEGNSSLETSLIANKMNAQMAGYLDYQTFKTNPEESGLPSDLEDPYRKVDMARLSLKYKRSFSSKNRIQVIPYVRFNRNRYVATWIPKAYPERDTKTYTFGVLNQDEVKHGLGKTIFGLDFELTKAKSHYFQTRSDVYIYGKLYPQGDIYNYDVDFYNIAPYIHNVFHFGDFTATAGLRYDYAKYRYDNKLTEGNFGDVWYRPADRSDEFSHLSPKLGLIYAISKNHSIFGRYAHGFRIPQAGTLYELKQGYQERPLAPEKADSYELGYRGLIERANFTYTLSGYYMEIKDKIVTVRETSLSYRANAGKTRHKGLELGAEWIPTESVKIRGSYSLSKHEYVNFNTGRKDYSGKEMKLAPKDLANVRFIYNPFFIRKLTLELEYQRVGSYYMDDENTKKYGGYEIYNAKAQFRVNKNFKLFAKVLNITDELYAETADIAYGRERYRPGMPRTLYAGVDVVW